MTASLAEPLLSPAGRALERGRDRLLATPERGRLLEGRARDQRRAWRPRICCCASSSAFATTRDPARDGGVDPLASRARTGAGRSSTAARPTSPRRSRPTPRCALAGDAAEAPHMLRAAALVRELGGIEKSRVFTRIWLALFGQWPWERLPALPPEVILLPSWFPLNIYDFASLGAADDRAAHAWWRRIGRSGPLGFDLARAARPASGRASSSRSRPGRVVSRRSTALLHVYEKHPLGPLRRQALALCAEWILKRQEADGCWGGIQPPWVYSIMALHLLGYSLDHPALRKGLDGTRVASRSARTGCVASRPVSRRCGTPRWRWSRCATRASRRTIPRCSEGRRSGC